MLPKKVIEFFLVDKECASKLVYYDKNYPQEQLLQKQPEEQPVPPPDGFEALEPYSIIVVGGTNMVKVQLAASFDDQNHVPRFKLDAGDRIEDDIRKWEQASIIEMNNKIRNFAMPVNPAIAMAHGITKEFLDMRRKMRLNKMLDYQPHCINTYTVLSNPLMKQILQEIQKKRKAIAYLARQ